jgi:hypothetical protein
MAAIPQAVTSDWRSNGVRPLSVFVSGLLLLVKFRSPATRESPSEYVGIGPVIYEFANMLWP